MTISPRGKNVFLIEVWHQRTGLPGPTSILGKSGPWLIWSQRAVSSTPWIQQIQSGACRFALGYVRHDKGTDGSGLGTGQQGTQSRQNLVRGL